MESNSIRKWLITGAISLAVLITVFCTCGIERIDAGCVGLRVNLAGGNKGVSKTEYCTGWQFYWKPATRIYEFPTYQQHAQYEPFDVPAKGGTIFSVHPTFNYNITAGNVADMFVRYRVPVKQLEDQYLRNSLLVSLREVTNTFTVDSMLNNIAGYDAAVSLKLNEKLYPYFLVSTFTSGLKPDPKLSDVITQKAQVLQEALQLENQQKKIRVQVENDLLESSRDSAVKMKAANAEANSIRVKQEALKQSPQYIELIKAERWDGKYPVYMLGNSANMLMQLPK